VRLASQQVLELTHYSYWIGIVLKIHRSKKPKGAANIDGEIDQKANLEVRWYFNPEELRFWGLCVCPLDHF
jgi:hypothetical protein